LTVTVPAASLKRKLSPRKKLQGLSAFVAVVPKGASPAFKLEPIAWRATAGERAFEGDFDGDHKPDAVIYVSPDDANNCDGEPKNNLTLSLLAGDGFDALRCCGP
jgi:hypothetical protein